MERERKGKETRGREMENGMEFRGDWGEGNREEEWKEPAIEREWKEREREKGNRIGGFPTYVITVPDRYRRTDDMQSHNRARSIAR